MSLFTEDERTFANMDDTTFQFDEDLPNDNGPFIREIRNNELNSENLRKLDELTLNDPLLTGYTYGPPLELGECQGNLIPPLEFEEDIDDKFIPRESEDMAPINESCPDLIPPENFSPVINSIYRSSFPRPENFEFLKKLKLKSILCLIPEDYPTENLENLESENIKLFQLGMSGNKEPFVKIPHDLITEAMKIVLNPENQPILIHCNRGKHRTGCLVGVIRRLQKWSLTIIFDEYRKFAAPKERAMDQQFIELYDETEITEYAEKNGLLPLKW